MTRSHPTGYSTEDKRSWNVQSQMQHRCHTPFFHSSGWLQRREQKDCKNHGWQMTKKKHGFWTQRHTQLHTGTHGVCNDMHKTRARSSQSKYQHGEERQPRVSVLAEEILATDGRRGRESQFSAGFATLQWKTAHPRAHGQHKVNLWA